MKVLSFFKKITLVVVCLFIFAIIGCYLCSRSYSRFDQDGQKAILANYSPAAENVYTDVTPNSETISQLNAFISSLPPNVSKVFSDEWKIIISPNLPTALNLRNSEQQAEPNSSNSLQEPLSVLGYSDWHFRLIFLKAQPEPDATYKVFIHELGHCFDYEFGTPSANDEFQQIYNQYKDTFIEADYLDLVSYANSSPEEFFATVFKEYFLTPEHLKTNAPLAYSFIADLYNEVSSNDAANTTVKYDLQSSLLILKKKLPVT